MGGRVPSGGTCSTYGTRVTSPSLLQKIFSELNEYPTARL
jgi:hypothetical protein